MISKYFLCLIKFYLPFKTWVISLVWNEEKQYQKIRHKTDDSIISKSTMSSSIRYPITLSLFFFRNHPSYFQAKSQVFSYRRIWRHKYPQQLVTQLITAVQCFKSFMQLLIIIQHLFLPSKLLNELKLTSNKSLQKPCIPYCFASIICFSNRFRTFSLSARVRRYLSWNKKIILIRKTNLCARILN